MTLPMFIDEDAHYEYERERYEEETGFWDNWDDDDWKPQFDGFRGYDE